MDGLSSLLAIHHPPGIIRAGIAPMSLGLHIGGWFLVSPIWPSTFLEKTASPGKTCALFGGGDVTGSSILFLESLYLRHPMKA